MLGRAKLILLGGLLWLPRFVLPGSDSEPAGSGPLTRRKRYVVFPEGSSFSIALCMTVHTLTPDNIFTEGLNWGISYDLPNESRPEPAPLLRRRGHQPDHKAAQYYPLAGANKYYKADYEYAQRRHRRHLYNKLELVIDAMGFDGRSCVLRALCEASQRFVPQGNSLLEEMMRIVFTLPLKRLFSFEPPEHHAYAGAHRAGRNGSDCLGMFPSCTFSLVDMALGKYNAPDDIHAAAAAAAAAVAAAKPLPLDLAFAMK